jgi:hypothetical protein
MKSETLRAVWIVIVGLLALAVLLGALLYIFH